MSKKGKLFAALAVMLTAAFESFAFKSNEAKSEWTFTSEEMDVLNEGFESLQNENKTLAEDKTKLTSEKAELSTELEKVKGEKADASTKLTTSEKSLTDIRSQLKLEASATDEQIKSAISKLIALPGATGIETETEDDDEITSGGKSKKPINSWEIKGNKKDSILKRAQNLH